MPVLMMSPIVRTRTVSSSTFSLGRGGRRIGDRQPLAVAANASAVMAEINCGNFELFLIDVFPDVHLRPIAQGKYAHMFARINACVVEVPDFRALIFRVPLAEAVAETEETLLGARFFFVPPRAANQAIKTKFFDRRQQRWDLQTVTADFSRRRNGNVL